VPDDLARADAPSAYAERVPARPVILDCDPGHDDALAILLALARPELRVLGITTVAGNAGVENTTRNALRVLTLLGRTDVPVAAGAGRPLVRPGRVAAHVHGASGLDGADLPEPAVGPVAEGAVEMLARLVRASADPVTLIPTGPLTNIALFVGTHPELLPRIAEISIMGGAIGEGNLTASAEFNIWADPEAAAIVLDCGRPVALAPLEVTHAALFRNADIPRVEALGTQTGRVFADLLRFFAIFHRERYGWDGSPIHDAVAVARLVVPGLVREIPYRVDVETESELTRGRTVVDLHGLRGLPPNARVGVEIDRPRFIDLLVDAIGQFP
jgi:pyrimidine-specific ribonucleoside hydrolase